MNIQQPVTTTALPPRPAATHPGGSVMLMDSAATAELAPLNDFVGIWEGEGEIYNDADAPQHFTATDTYEWLPGGHFMLHRFEAAMPEGRLVGIEIIGFDRAHHAFTLHAYDSSGSAEVMQGRRMKDIWRFVGRRMRFTGSFRSHARLFSGLWEQRSDDGDSWRPWMRVELRKLE